MSYRYAISGVGTLLPGGCSVCVPMQGVAPDIRGKGELEVAASWLLTNRLEVGATYSPTSPRAGAGGHQPQARPARHYWPRQIRTDKAARAGRRHLVAAGPALVGERVGGFWVNARYVNDDYAMDPQPPTNFAQHQFDAIYRKYSGEAYGIWQPTPRLSLGLSYWVVQVRLTYRRCRRGRARAGGPHSALRVDAVWPAAAGGPGGCGAAASGWASVFGAITGDDFDPARQFRLNRS